MPDSVRQITVIMITLNEAHNLSEVFQNLEGFADEVIVIDSFSSDGTVEIARNNGAIVYQRSFTGFGEQWNYAVNKLPVTSQWVMKLDPDERLSDELKGSIKNEIATSNAEGFQVSRRLWFMGKPLPITQKILRIWKTGACQFTDVSVNEHPIVRGKIETLDGNLEHYDSPDLHHWVDKQNRYTSAEALAKFNGTRLSVKASLLGNELARRMWVKNTSQNFLFDTGWFLFIVFLFRAHGAQEWWDTSGRVCVQRFIACGSTNCLKCKYGRKFRRRKINPTKSYPLISKVSTHDPGHIAVTRSLFKRTVSFRAAIVPCS